MSTQISGEWRQPRNTAADQKGGIHDDDTATDLGFRGGTVAGAIHMEQFPPLMETLFGTDWWQRGGLSLYFKSATIDLEPVRCFADGVSTGGDSADDVKRSRIWMEKEDGTVVMAGSASLGDDPNTELRARLGKLRPASELRVFADMHVGDECDPQATRVDAALLDQQLQVITEPMPYYTTDATYGGRVLSATQVVRSIVPAERKLTEAAKPPFVGLYGGIEIQYHNGPLLADYDYLVSGRIVGLSDSPQTEIVWWQFELTDGAKKVATVLKMDRIMKGSSPLWSDAADG